MQYTISWEKDESDVNLEGNRSSFIPGVTHLQSRVGKQPLGQAIHNSRPTGPSTKAKKNSEMKPQKGKRQEAPPEQNNVPQVEGKDVTLRNLRPEDKKRVANLIKELAKAGEEKQEVMGQLTVERNQFKSKQSSLEARVKALASEREAIQQQYLQCQMLLAQSQEKLSREQIQHAELIRNDQPERDLSGKKSTTQKGFPEPRQVSTPSKDTNQFRPAFQSTTRPRQAPANQQPPTHCQVGYPMTSQLPERGPSNPFSPTIFSADEFRPLPVELCSTSLGVLDGADDMDALEPVREAGYNGKGTVKESSHHTNQDQRRQVQDGLHTSSGRQDVMEANHNASRPIQGKGRLDYGFPGNNLSKSEVGHSHQIGSSSPKSLSGMERESSNQRRMITPEQLSQSSGRGSPLHSDGNPPGQKSLDTPDMLVERKKRLDGQKAQLRREQDWLRKQLKNQAELLHQKQLELEAHRESLLDSPHPGGQTGGGALRPRSRGVGSVWIKRSLQGELPSERHSLETDRSSLGNAPLAADGGLFLDGRNHLGQVTGPFHSQVEHGSSRNERFILDNEQLLHEQQWLQTHGQASHSGQIGVNTGQPVAHGPSVASHSIAHSSEGIGHDLGKRNRLNGHSVAELHHGRSLGVHQYPVEHRASDDEWRQASVNPNFQGYPLGGRATELECNSSGVQYRGQERKPLYGQIMRDPPLIAMREIRGVEGEISRGRAGEPVGMSNGQPVPSGSHRNPKDEMENVRTQRGPDRIQGSVALHSDSIIKGRRADDSQLHHTVDASTSPIGAPHPRGRRMSPAVHHPRSGLTRDTWEDDTSSTELSSRDHYVLSGREQLGRSHDAADLNLLHHLIEDLNQLPATEVSSNPGRLLPAPVFTAATKDTAGSLHHSNGFSRHHGAADGTTSLATRGRGILVGDSSLSRVIGSEIVESSDGEEESRILDDIFFLN